LDGVKRRILIALGLTALGIALYLALRSSPPPVVLLSPGQVPPQRISMLARLVPRTPRWGWVWRLREKVRRQPGQVRIETEAVRFAAGFRAKEGQLAQPAATTAEGLEVWLLDAEALNALKGQLKRTAGAESLFPARITAAVGTSHGVRVPTRGANVGWSLDLFPRVRGPVTDLTASILWSEAVTNQAPLPPGTGESISIQTNLSVTARFQLANGGGVFLYQPASSGAHRKPLGVLLSTARVGKP
jgi:hypothetical protein